MQCKWLPQLLIKINVKYTIKFMAPSSTLYSRNLCGCTASRKYRGQPRMENMKIHNSCFLRSLFCRRLDKYSELLAGSVNSWKLCFLAGLRESLFFAFISDLILSNCVYQGSDLEWRLSYFTGIAQESLQKPY